MLSIQQGHPARAVVHLPHPARSKVQPLDKGTISPVIQTTHQSRIPSSRPRTVVHLKGKDTRSDPKHKLEQKC